MNFQSLELAVSRTENLSARPTSLIQILRLYSEHHVSASMLEKVIEQDPALTAKVLKVASSAAYGNRKNLTIATAIGVVGLKTLRSLAASLAYQEILNKKGPGAGFDRAVFGRHCLATAIASRHIAQEFRKDNAEELYIAGLMHEIGILTLDRFVAHILTLAIKRSVITNQSLVSVEKELLKYDHYEVGGMVAQKWNLTPTMQKVIRYHNSPHLENPPSLETAIVVGGNYIATQCGFPVIKGVPLDEDSEVRFHELGLSKEQSQKIEDKVFAEIEISEKSNGDSVSQSPQAVSA